MDDKRPTYNEDLGKAIQPGYRRCGNGHVFDITIFGENCPFCSDGSEKGRVLLDKDHCVVYGPPIPPMGNNDGVLVGLLITYSHNPQGEVYYLYDGKLACVGRSTLCNIAFSEDKYMSGEHLIIKYLKAKNQFIAKDCWSTHGTFVNGKLYEGFDSIMLNSGDIIVIGHTKLVFFAIPHALAFPDPKRS